MKINMDYTTNYITSIAIGIFIGSIFLFISRLFNFPITGIILSILLSSLIAAFIYNPSKKEVKHRSIRGVGASFIFSLLFSLILMVYYIPKFNNLVGNIDLTSGIIVLAVVFITVIGGIILGSIGGSIGSTVRDIISVISIERKNRKKIK